ncbi:proproteinase E-like, partial [Ochotona curzoniae]|uniref:proproteinase E-like n=1 Tax=Ochotona curzoniae TaxID=130825 RepID=UPI001B348FA8
SGSHPPIHIPSSNVFNPSSRVVNGVPVQPHNKWPWQVALLYEMNGGLYFICGGSLIDPNWVMTAAHCFPYEGTYWALLGAYNLSAIPATAQVIPGQSYIVHGDYNASNAANGNDIALLKLSRSAELTDDVQLACLPPAGYCPPHGAECYISGWGSTYTGGPASSVLMEGLMPVVDYEHCSQPDWWGSTVNECHLCAGGYDVSGCNGDSGGPLNCPTEDGCWKVCGVASFVSARGCNTEKKPTVFTCVGCFIEWIEENAILYFFYGRTLIHQTLLGYDCQALHLMSSLLS